jgi:hypothetical protein
MSKEDLDPEIVDAFVDDRLDDYLDFLLERFDTPEARNKYCTSRNSKYLEFKAKYEEDLFDSYVDHDDYDKTKH